MLKITAQPNDTVSLLIEWEVAKLAEEKATAVRRTIEGRLSEIFTAPLGGQKTHRVDNYRVVRKNNLYIRGDVEKVQVVANELQLPPLLKPAIWESGCKKLMKEDPTSFGLLVEEGALKAVEGTPHFEISHVG